ncbi:uncharacterized protein EV422DRAFT_530841 [Fimicolochytrium jonesii]|uniref:uncharacterized protein n=1 Tax=Fimicolochytrium jonesii TaxID=1396493 RepID=UPI0022FF2955|nr:uncharacterized protein EV422DRAFT_530841 [Fimicolochytrium jonesii]KAI8820422.1 hypothetical protein EV422DRAFT_530841 [Fimicolochytrium jonesii]
MEWDQADPAREKGKQPAAVNADDDDRHSARIPPSPAQRHRSLTSNTIHPPSPTRTETSPSRLPGSDGAGSFPFTASETPQPAPRSNSDPFPFPLRTTIPLRRPHLAAELNVVDDQMDVVAPANPFFDDFVESARPESGASSTAGAPSEGRKEVPAVPQETSSGSSGDSSFPAPPTAPAPTSTTTTTTTTEPHQPLPPTLPPPRNTSGSSITTAATETTESTLLASINPDQPSRNTTGGTTTTTISTVSNPSFTRPPNNPPNNATSHPPVVDMPTLQAQNGALAARNEFLERRCRELAGLLGECNEMVRHMRGELAALKGVVGRVRELRALLEGLCGELAGEAGLAGL